MTGETSGFIASSSFSLNVGATSYYNDIVVTSYHSSPGDSGGLAYQLSGNTAYPAGIHILSVDPLLFSLGGGDTSVEPSQGDSYKAYCKIAYVLAYLNATIIS